MLDKSFKDILYENLVIIDDILDKNKVLVNLRPLQATCMFRKHCIISLKKNHHIIDIKGDIERDMLRSVYELAKEWYRAKYGPAVDHQCNDYIIASVILIHGMPYHLNVPLTIMGRKEGNATWYHLPNSVLGNEDILEWVIDGPDPSNLAKNDLMPVKEDIFNISTYIRKIHTNLMNAVYKTEEMHSLSNAIMEIMQDAAKHMVSQKSVNMQHACWEIFFAAEKALKLLIQQQSGQPLKKREQNHRIKELCEKKVGLCWCNKFDKLPSNEKAISQRYNEGRPYTPSELFVQYKTALEIVFNASSELRKKHIVGIDVKFLIRPFF